MRQRMVHCPNCKLLLFLGLANTSAFTLTVAHINDTHSHIDPGELSLRVGSQTIKAEVGGYGRLKSIIDGMRRDPNPLLLLHAGDAVQGTPYFTFFDGSLDFELLKTLGVDAMVLGNHEFDRGIAPLSGWQKRSKFPWLGANIDVSQEPALKGRVLPFIIKEIAGEQVGIIGVTTEAVAQLTLDVGNTKFLDPREAVQTCVSQLTARGVHTIIVLSHLGYHRDIALATHVSGIDLIVGGHSHTLLEREGEFSSLGLRTQGRYPTEVLAPDGKKVLIVQAWQWGQALGAIKMTFNAAGDIIAYRARVILPVGDTFRRHGKILLPGSLRYLAVKNALLHSPAVVIALKMPRCRERSLLIASD